jgi:hypothetical protein
LDCAYCGTVRAVNIEEMGKLNRPNGAQEHSGDGNTMVTWPDGVTKVSGAVVKAREIEDRWS